MIARRTAGRLASAVLLSLGVASAATTASTADAFCGFYVGGAGAKLFNDATVVVLMREGTRTVLSMQNAYKGPPEKFAMVVPVPVVLQEENVKTLPRELFDRVDQLAAPRLVEYWEQDPCAPVEPMERGIPMPNAAPPTAARTLETGSYGVKIEAQFTVGEYQIVVLSARDSGGLEAWLRKEKYAIPEGAAPYFKPYIASGSKFFVARVDIDKVKMEGGLAVLSPLRFHYDSESFSLPVKLGLINSSGTQDLLVHVLAKGKRYEVANYPNVTIPTNLDVSESARDQFATFYTTLFDKTVEKNPKAVVTEYAWDASSCDPCPGPSLSANDLATLGADVLPSAFADGIAPPAPLSPPSPPSQASRPGPKLGGGEAVNPSPPSAPPRRPWGPSFGGGGFTLTRLHARYTKESLGEDLVFKEAPAIMGGRELRGAGGALETGAATKNAWTNNFQARYAIRHPWTGPIACKEPRRGVWGGPPNAAADRPSTKAAQKIGLTPRDPKATLASFLAQDVPELAVAALSKGGAGAGVNAGTGPGANAGAADASADGAKKGCAGCATIPRTEGALGASLASLAALAVMLGLRARRRARSH